MILSGLEIAFRMGKDIEIDPYGPAQFNPNSYNLRLHNELLVYDAAVLDMKLENKASKRTNSATGLQLGLGRLNLGRTLEKTHTDTLAPMLEAEVALVG